MKMRKWVCLFCIQAIVLLLAGTATADPVGILKVTSGNGTFTFSLSSMIFNVDTSGNPAGPPWNAEVANTTSLTFAGCPSGVLATAGCLDSGTFSPAEAVMFANNTPIVLGAGLGPNNPFIVFAGNGISHATILFTVINIGPGSSNTNCAGLSIGQSCSLFAGDPLILTLTATGTTLSLDFAGTATDGAGTSNWEGGLSEVITGMSPQQIQLFFCPSGTCTAADFTSGNSITQPWSGDFLATAGGGNTGGQTPEPSSILLLLTGAGGILGFARRRFMA